MDAFRTDDYHWVLKLTFEEYQNIVTISEKMGKRVKDVISETTRLGLDRLKRVYL